MSRDEQIKAARAKLRVTMPGLKESVGAGDVVHKVTKALGMHHCSECERRKAALNRLFAFKAKLKEEK
jgi:hypothetical protein